MKTEPDLNLNININININKSFSTESSSPMVARRVAALEREASAIVELGKRAGVNLTYEGIAPMFNQPVIYSGSESDWLLAPVGTDEVPVVPREQQAMLRRLEAIGAIFPAIFVAHEVQKGKFSGPRDAVGSMALVSRQQAGELAGPTPLPAESVELAHRLNARADKIFRAIRTAAATAGVVAAAPFALVGSAVGTLATLDPIIFGVIPALSSRVGEPAAWYVLARWNW